MIKVTVDSATEYYWISTILSAGSLNCCEPYVLQALGCGLHQTVHFEKSENYVENLKDKMDELKERFGEVSVYQMNEMLRKESEDREKEKINKEGVVV
jgi:hypothetical protein